MSKIIDAVSIVMTFQDEIFVIQRQNFLNAFPGYWAFPGGKVDKGDEAFAIDHPLVNNIEPRLFGAVKREAQEELGVNFHDEIHKGSIKEIHFLGVAITPDFNPYRFATHFYRIELSQKINFTVDANEAQKAYWVKAKDHLEAFRRGEILAVPPVIRVMEVLGQNPKSTSIPDLNFEYNSAEYVPWIESIFGVKQFMPLSHTLPPATRTNSFLIGEVLLDPSPQDETEYQKLLKTLKAFKITKILLTHHHPDHYERSNMLARELDVPILLSLDTFNRITRKEKDYFKDVKTQFLKEGDIVTSWLDQKVIVMEVPGHDEGQIALYPESLNWFIAGDLFQGLGSVVIGGEEGDMKKYFETLEKVIKLSPKVVFPSHGIALGGVNILEKNLTHRKMREEQVLKLHQKGLTPDEMLEELYQDVGKELWPYALENINKHLQKLRAQKVI